MTFALPAYLMQPMGQTGRLFTSIQIKELSRLLESVERRQVYIFGISVQF